MNRILGIDEVGRGAWAGPMAVGAVVLGNAKIDGLADSKKLTTKKRQKLAREICEKARSIGIGWVSARTIDEIGLGPALKLAARKAAAQINCDYDEIIIDGTIKLLDDPRVTTLAKADSLIQSVSAAAIVAKVARDNYMHRLHAVFPDYGFDGHVGYGTAKHAAALAKCGASPIHRASFAPVARALGDIPTDQPKFLRTSGHLAETIAAEHLQRIGHTILQRNWRTKFCEIDIISMCENRLHFTEVKYRRATMQGDGLSAITPKKLKQMNFAAEIWLQQHENPATETVLSALSLTGTPPEFEQFVEVV